jgi:DNA polymerase III psi subunit
MSTPWSAEQTQWLQAMGHQVWTLPAADASPAQATTTIQEAATLLKPATPERTERPRQVSAPRAPAPTAQDRLMQAILRAANRAAGDVAVSALLPDPSALRGNAVAKRALWPQLRRLRRPVEGE